MSPRHVTAALAATIALAGTAAAAPAAHASFSLELKAAGWVERDATRYYPRYDFTASCDQYSRTRFWCTVFGSAGNCYRSGHASVRLTRTTWWVTVRHLEQTCY
jgi:hypothetical protein